MKRWLFAETFAVPLLDSQHGEPTVQYDEARCLNVTADGRPFIETAPVGRTGTATQTKDEKDDFDGGDDEYVFGQFGTVTKVKSEQDDFAASAPMFATETREAPGEQDDFCRAEAVVGTETAADGESDDFCRAEAMFGSQTAGRGEQLADDFGSDDARLGTKTAVRGEADDFSQEPEDLVRIRAASA